MLHVQGVPPDHHNGGHTEQANDLKEMRLLKYSVHSSEDLRARFRQMHELGLAWATRYKLRHGVVFLSRYNVAGAPPIHLSPHQ